MKFTLDGNTFEIKCTTEGIRRKENEHTAQCLLNIFSMYAGEASESYEEDNYNGLANHAKRIADSLEKQLREAVLPATRGERFIQ